MDSFRNKELKSDILAYAPGVRRKENAVTSPRLLVFFSPRLHFHLTLCLCALCAFLLPSCNRGLAPVQPSTSAKPGFSGTVTFLPPWPPADSIQDLRVVAFDNYPPTNILSEVLTGQAKVYPAIGPGSTGLPEFVDSVSYSFNLDSAETFQYVAVAMQYGPNPLQDWKVVGAYGYSHGAGQPKEVIVPANKFINGINIEVDFQNPPPNPLGGVAAADRPH